MGAALRDTPIADAGRLQVLVELGAPGGRTGARDLETGLAVAAAVRNTRSLRLAGVAGYEGALSHSREHDGLQVVAHYLSELGALHHLILERGWYDEQQRPIVTAGGSAYFDVVAAVLSSWAPRARVVLRSGAYLVHDDGFYRHISPLGELRRTDAPTLRSAMHGWVRVTSVPERGLALFDAGKRDLPYDEGLPVPQLRRAPVAGQASTALDGARITALNDQHGFLSFDPEVDPVVVGDELRLGLSHPCTAFDKWSLIPVVDDADAADPLVVDLVRTWF
ncbi:amino acid deaminase [Luteipulveratus mongoliensis]|uniref:amino acid deaminase n=1 Tax=Luteipulveratus mongoliensis TaxID=571913 RepID=UPI000B31AC31|nr:amino acid deaminase [Luteipulveratus mongoliensis]